MKVALGFWGLPRSLKYTYQSIQANVLNVLKENNIEYTIYMHTYNVYEKYSNPRAKEKDIILDNNEYKILKPDHILTDNQDNIKIKLNLKKYRRHPDPWKTKYITVDNFILAMYSKTQLSNMIKNSGNIYDYIIFLRPDVKYLNKLNIQWLKLATKSTICIPNFHLHSNFNDRFAITTNDTYYLYGALFDKLYDYSKKYSLHSEQFISRQLQNNNITWVKIDFIFARIRATGKVCNRDTKLLNQVQKKEGSIKEATHQKK